MALTVDSDLALTGGQLRRLPSEISANPFSGSLLSYASDGYVHELVAGEPFAGICRQSIQTADVATADGSRFIDAICGLFVGTIVLSATVADIGRRVYATDDGTFSFTQAAASTFLGRVIGIESSSKAIVQFQSVGILHDEYFTLAAAGTALTNSTTRTALASHTIKAGSLRAGSRIRVRALAIATATNSTDTLLLDIGGAVGGTPAALASAAATDVANNDISLFDLDLVVRTIGDTGTVVGAGHYTRTPAAQDTAVTKPILVASATINTNADFVLGLYGTWSVASASNSCRADAFNVDIIR